MIPLETDYLDYYWYQWALGPRETDDDSLYQEILPLSFIEKNSAMKKKIFFLFTFIWMFIFSN